MDDKMRAKLRKLGVVKGTRTLKPPPPPARHTAPAPVEPDDLAPPGAAKNDDPLPLTQLLPGITLEDNDYGACLVLDKVYPLGHHHGDLRLGDLLEQTTEAAARFCRDARLEKLAFSDLLFLDTETTGLSGAGAIAFMVGAAFFEGSPAADKLVVRQYFLRDHGDEAAMLSHLGQLVRSRLALATFNGKSFDLPLLDNRYLLNSLESPLFDLPHIDMLPPSRRLWRSRLGSCALSALEPNLLAVNRTQQDVPGYLIPALYHDYLRSGDARDLLRVFYHNELDMLSMVTLLSRITKLFDGGGSDDDPIDVLSLGRWQLALGMEGEAESNLRMAVSAELPLPHYHQALYQLGAMLKRRDRREEACLMWQQIAATSFDDVGAHVELAKHHEWQTRDLETALTWTSQALDLTNGGPQSHRTPWIRQELEYRLARLNRKIAAKQ